MKKNTIDAQTNQKLMNIMGNKKSIDDLIEEINVFNDKLTVHNSKPLTSPLNVKKLEDVIIDSNLINKQAEEELFEYKNDNINKINSNYTLKNDELNKDKKTLLDNYSTTKDSITSNYEKIKQNANDDALKRGLQRSSIIIKQLEAFNNDQINNYNELDFELNSKINALDFEINALSTQQEQALMDFDIAYAVKLNTKISELKNELLEKQQYVIKYNNEIEKIEADYDLKYKNLSQDIENKNWDKDIDLIEITTKYGTSVIENYKKNQIYNLVKDYLIKNDESLSEILKYPQVVNLLGTNLINKLKYEFGGK